MLSTLLPRTGITTNWPLLTGLHCHHQHPALCKESSHKRFSNNYGPVPWNLRCIKTSPECVQPHGGLYQLRVGLLTPCLLHALMLGQFSGVGIEPAHEKLCSTCEELCPIWKASLVPRLRQHQLHLTKGLAATAQPHGANKCNNFCHYCPSCVFLNHCLQKCVQLVGLEAEEQRQTRDHPQQTRSNSRTSRAAPPSFSACGSDPPPRQHVWLQGQTETR